MDQDDGDKKNPAFIGGCFGASTRWRAILAVTLLTSLAQGQSLKHIIIIVKENRSFDHYFGQFPGVTGGPITSYSAWEQTVDAQATALPLFQAIGFIDTDGSVKPGRMVATTSTLQAAFSHRPHRYSSD